MEVGEEHVFLSCVFFVANCFLLRCGIGSGSFGLAPGDSLSHHLQLSLMQLQKKKSQVVVLVMATVNSIKSNITLGWLINVVITLLLVTRNALVYSKR